jgi:acetyltransferase-like isoleucine patch superfamily enzyme
LVLGDGVFVGRGVVVSAHRKVSIGKDTMLGEFVSIHDNDHRLDKPDLPISQQGFMAEPLEIGASCWIGAKAVLVRGSGMEERCVLGAGAVLTARLAAGTRAVGVPARPLAGRTPSVQS